MSDTIPRTEHKVMRKSAVALAIAVLAFPPRAETKPTYVPPDGYVPDEKTAIRIAKAVLGSVYGEARTEAQEPSTAALKDGVWTIEGRLPPVSLAASPLSKYRNRTHASSG